MDMVGTATVRHRPASQGKAAPKIRGSGIALGAPSCLRPAMTPSGVREPRKRGVWSEGAVMRLLGNGALPTQKLCFDHTLAYVELFFPGTIEKY
jgi:hypothetical protein